MFAQFTRNQATDVFAVDASHSTPVFHQLHDRVVAALADGRLTPGQQLPTVRALADALGIAPNTVAKAYKSLELAGVVVGKGRAGTFVRLETDPLEAAAQQLALNAAQNFVRLGVTEAQAQAHLTQAFRALPSAQ